MTAWHVFSVTAHLEADPEDGNPEVGPLPPVWVADPDGGRELGLLECDEVDLDSLYAAGFLASDDQADYVVDESFDGDEAWVVDQWGKPVLHLVHG